MSSSALLSSSSPVPQHLALPGQRSGSPESDGSIVEIQDGEISPSFDASFASNLSFNGPESESTSEKQSTDRMDFSPAVASHKQQQRRRAPQLSSVIGKTRSRPLDRAQTYDSSFFSQLTSQARRNSISAENHPPSQHANNKNTGKDAPAPPTMRADLASTRANHRAARMFGDVLDGNADAASASTASASNSAAKPLFSRPPLQKTQTENILPLQSKAATSSNTTAPAPAPGSRPSLLRTKGHAASASMGVLDFGKPSSFGSATDSQSPASIFQPPPRTRPNLPASSKWSRHQRSNSDVGSQQSSWISSQPPPQRPIPAPRTSSDPQQAATFSIPEESPNLDRMELDSPPLPIQGLQQQQNDAMDLDDGSPEHLSKLCAEVEVSIEPPALMSASQQQTRVQHADFGDFFSASPAPREETMPVADSVPGSRKRSFEPDQSLELSSEDASPSSPLAQLTGPARPSLQKAASSAAVLGGSILSRRRTSDRSSGSRAGGSSNSSSRRPSMEDVAPSDDRVQMQKKARAETTDAVPTRATARPILIDTRRAQSAVESSTLEKRRPATATFNKATASSLGLGLPPAARSSSFHASGSSESVSFKPRHLASASESYMSFRDNQKRRVASDSVKSGLGSNGPDSLPETRMESDGKRLPCHSVAEDGLMRVRPEIVSDLLQGKYRQSVESYTIVDCRFPYEYEGGHIQGAVNLNEEDHLRDYFMTPGQGLLNSGRQLPEACVSDDPGPKPVIIFHCEFSQKRAPVIAGALRKLDRARGHEYPRVHYPEIYVLAGGYAELFKSFSHLCSPQAYVPMLQSSQGERAYDSFHCRSKPGFAFTRAKSFSALEGSRMLHKGSEPSQQAKPKESSKLAPPIAMTSSHIVVEDDHETSIDSSISSPGKEDDSPCPGARPKRTIPKEQKPVFPGRQFCRAATTAGIPFNGSKQLFGNC